MAVLDRSCRACFYLLRELAVRDPPGGPLLAIFDTYCADPATGGEAALTAAYRIAPPATLRAAQQAVVAQGLLPAGAFFTPGGDMR